MQPSGRLKFAGFSQRTGGTEFLAAGASGACAIHCRCVRLAIAGFSLALTMYYAAVRSHGYELAVEIVTVLLVIDLDEKSYGAASSTVPDAVAALEAWAVEHSQKRQGKCGGGGEIVGTAEKEAHA